MVENRNKSAIRQFEKCPDCGANVLLKYGNEHRLVLYNPDETLHVCGLGEPQFEKHPIGQAVMGHKIDDYQLRGRRLTITLDDGSILSVTAAGTPLTIRFQGPAGMMEE